MNNEVVASIWRRRVAWSNAANKLKIDSVTLQMGIKLGAEGSVFVAKASTEGNIVITLSLKP